ncbi:MAG TPA: SGNH hydrolase domain-containing protein [Mycobacteriales bacterium]|nr:SGNH hydrolase domain-containing protein [Mycobacteriales bacterium]
MAVLVAGVKAGSAGPVRLLRLPPLQVIARASYSWYLWHWPPLVLAPVVLGRELSPVSTLVVCVATLVLAQVTVVAVEDPVRFSRPLTLRPAASLATGAALTSAAVVTSLLTATLVPPVAGHGVAAAAVQLPAARPAAAVRPRGEATGVSPLQARVSFAVAQGVGIRAVPANLDPSLTRAPADKALPFLDGCHLSFTASVSGTCSYGDRASPTRVVLFGDSHATQWFPALERAAQARHWRLEVLAKSTCPPVLVPIVSPVLGRGYRECERWRESVLARVAAERPALVVLGTARHYGPMYRFAVYGPQWLGGLRDMVGRLRTTGTRVVVLGPTPKPIVNVPECLSEHVTDARACTGPVAQLVNRVGMRGERAAVEAAGGRYVDVTPWICTSTTCAVIVANLLV